MCLCVCACHAIHTSPEAEVCHVVQVRHFVEAVAAEPLVVVGHKRTAHDYVGFEAFLIVDLCTS